MTAERLVILSGPSGVGKGPIVEWTKNNMAKEGLGIAHVYKTRTPRHTSDPNANLPKPIGNPTILYCRGSRQEIYLDSIKETLDKNRYVLIETYYSAHDMLKSEFGKDTEVTSVFITPISKYYAGYLRDFSYDGLNGCIRNMMLNSTLRRAINEDKKLTKELLFDLEARADDAVFELKFAKNYDLVLPNEKHEYMPGWSEKKLSGEYLQVVDSLCDIIKTGNSRYACPGKDYVF